VSPEEFHRKLTAILSADVQGYSRLMGEDEDSTVRTLTAYRTLMISLIQKHMGHVVDTPGDNLLAKFGSVMDAVRCAVEIQEELRIRNGELPENRKMMFRIRELIKRFRRLLKSSELPISLRVALGRQAMYCALQLN